MPPWAWGIIAVVLVIVVVPPAVYIIVKKLLSHFTQADQNVREDIGNSPPSFAASAVLSRQLGNAEPLGAGATGENSSVSVSFGLVVFYIKNVSRKSR